MWMFLLGFIFGVITGLISKKALYFEITYKGENKNGTKKSKNDVE